MKLSDLDLDSKMIMALKKAQIVEAKQILYFSNTELQHLTNISSDNILKLKEKVAERYIHQRCNNALNIYQKEVPLQLQHWKLSTACRTIDSILRGGILSGVLTEITGESGCGKTQLCLQLCISVQFNKERAGGAVFICTEDAFPSKRLQQMIQHYGQFLPGQNLGDKIFVEHVADFDTLEFCVKKKLPTLINRGLIQLVVLDSVTALFRCQYDSSQLLSRAKHLIEFASTLRQLAHQNSIIVVCVNQVSANMNKIGLQDSDVVPALGLTWSNQMTCRILLSRFTYHEEYTDDSGQAMSRRKLKVIFAPHLRQSELDIQISDCGIQGIKPQFVNT
uniref:RecA family profile 1 domain-containing protein n=1 Tax=Biomphalaria glabrata TaxID=6526 RepID=A0A2C9LZQ0_BIOGL